MRHFLLGVCFIFTLFSGSVLAFQDAESAPPIVREMPIFSEIVSSGRELRLTGKCSYEPSVDKVVEKMEQPKKFTRTVTYHMGAKEECWRESGANRKECEECMFVYHDTSQPVSLGQMAAEGSDSSGADAVN